MQGGEFSMEEAVEIWKTAYNFMLPPPQLKVMEFPGQTEEDRLWVRCYLQNLEDIRKRKEEAEWEASRRKEYEEYSDIEEPIYYEGDYV